MTSRSAGSWTGYPAVTTNTDSTSGALAGMAKVGNPRVPMGQGAIQATAAPVLKGKLVSKGHSKDSTPQGIKGYKTNVLANEHMGARHGISVKMPGGTQENANLQANGRIVPNVMGQRPNFNSQVDSYGSWGPR